MPRLENIRDERRKAENEVTLLKARVRLIRDTALQNERKLRRERKLRTQRETVQGDAHWMRETLEQEFMKRDMENAEKKEHAAEMKKQNIAYRNQSKQILREQKAETARKKREEIQYRLDAAYDQQQRDWERRKHMADEKRKHTEWYKEMSSMAAKEFADRTSEMRNMAIAEEETRNWMIVERRYQIMDALEYEEQRLLQVRQDRMNVTELLNKPFNESNSLADDNISIASSTVKPTKYHISGPGMATVIRGSNSLHRVHFPFTVQDQKNFTFDMESPKVNPRGLRPTGGLRR